MRKGLQTYYDFIIETALEAGNITLGKFPPKNRFSIKEDGSPVTEVDRETELFIRSKIEKRFPTHDIVGEEIRTDAEKQNGYRWFIDPIDGTNYFIRGIPLYSMIIGLEIDGVVDLGLLYFPARGDLLVAATGMGCWWNGKPAHVSSVSDLADGIVAYSDILNFDKYGKTEEFSRISSACHYRAGWSDGLGYLFAATGRVELMIEAVVGVWDVAPYPVIFREAGGFFGNWQGEETIYSEQVMACNRAVLPQVIDLLNSSKE